MNEVDPAKHTPEALDALRALRRARERAEEVAARTGTALVFARGGHIVRVEPRRAASASGALRDSSVAEIDGDVIGATRAPQDALVASVLTVARARRADLERIKANARAPERADLWQALLRSLGTHGGSKGWQGLNEPARLARLSYATLVTLSPEQRTATAEDVFRAAKVRWPARKARTLAANVEHVHAQGGLETVQRKYDSLVDRREILDYLKTFEGIGDKYARNIPMDAYHRAFRGAIAIDARIKSVSTELGLTFMSYEDAESFYVRVADAANLEPWELDRLLYNFTDDVLRELRRAAGPGLER